MRWKASVYFIIVLTSIICIPRISRHEKRNIYIIRFGKLPVHA